MLAARPHPERDEGDDALRPLRRPDPADWLTLQQAACELNVSMSTVRRRIRQGELRNRIVPRRGGFAYLVYVPNSRHARDMRLHGHVERSRESQHACASPVDLDGYRRERYAGPPPIVAADPASRDDEVRRLQEQVERLSEALARALKMKQRALPAGMGQPSVNPDDPYARYRWLVRKRRWWPF